MYREQNRRQAVDTDILIDALKVKCCAFGVDITKSELVYAALPALPQQTETALEASILQSLRADRFFASRTSRHR